MTHMEDRTKERCIFDMGMVEDNGISFIEISNMSVKQDTFLIEPL